MPKKKKEEIEELKVEVPKKYFARDAYDRIFTKDANGFDLELQGGRAVEVSEEVAKQLKEKFSYVEVTEEAE